MNMRNVAFIPVRGGSKSIPLKNIKELCGKPLVYWTVKAANDCAYIDRVYVSTDSPAIAETVEGFSLKKVEVIGRSGHTATDTASTESAMLEFAVNYEFDNIALIQATSPMLTSRDLNKGFEIFSEDGTDSVLSAVRQKRFNWTVNEDGYAKPLNYDIYHRPRRQDFAGYLVENGAFYITSRERLIDTENRMSGNIKIAEMSEETFYEIDEQSDWNIVEHLMKLKSNYFAQDK
jgi:N-acylneuraminate cytidylyltransferase